MTKPTILIVEDHPGTARDLKSILSREISGTVKVAKDGAEAVDLADQLRPDVVVLDVDLPVIDGFEVLEQIKKRGIATRILMLTGVAVDLDSAIRAVKAGACDYLIKPVDTDTIVARVKRAMVTESAINLHITEHMPAFVQKLADQIEERTRTEGHDDIATAILKRHRHHKRFRPGEGIDLRDGEDGESTFASRFLTFWTSIPGMLTGIAALIGAVATLIALFHQPADTEYNRPVLNATGDLTTFDDWRFYPFEGGDAAAAHLSLPSEQPRPENVYATLVAPDDKRNWILVWWKRDKSGFVYNYTGRSWDKHNPANFVLPIPKKNEVPISLGGRGYQTFLFFQATAGAASASANPSAPK